MKLRRRRLRIQILLLPLVFVIALPGGARTQPAETLRIYVARHGQTDWNVESRLQGGTDTPLNATGRQQALQLAERIKGIHLDAVSSSGLRRSRETAELVVGSATVTSLPRLNERRLGKFEGRTLARSTTGGGAAPARSRPTILSRESTTVVSSIRRILWTEENRSRSSPPESARRPPSWPPGSWRSSGFRCRQPRAPPTTPTASLRSSKRCVS